MKKLYYLYNTSNKELVKLRIKRALLVISFLIVLMLLFDAISAFGTEKSTVPNYSQAYIEVQRGDTLFDIAKVYAPKNTDVDDYVEFLMAINNMQDSKLFVGQKLMVREY